MTGSVLRHQHHIPLWDIMIVGQVAYRPTLTYSAFASPITYVPGGATPLLLLAPPSLLVLMAPLRPLNHPPPPPEDSTTTSFSFFAPSARVLLVVDAGVDCPGSYGSDTPIIPPAQRRFSSIPFQTPFTHPRGSGSSLPRPCTQKVTSK